jgi:hypothetical protein
VLSRHSRTKELAVIIADSTSGFCGPHRVLVIRYCPEVIPGQGPDRCERDRERCAKGLAPPYEDPARIPRTPGRGLPFALATASRSTLAYGSASLLRRWRSWRSTINKRLGKPTPVAHATGCHLAALVQTLEAIPHPGKHLDQRDLNSV